MQNKQSFYIDFRARVNLCSHDHPTYHYLGASDSRVPSRPLGYVGRIMGVPLNQGDQLRLDIEKPRREDHFFPPLRE